MDLLALADRFHLALLERGASQPYARKMALAAIAAGSDPAGFLEARSASWTAATLADRRNRLAIFGRWLAQAEGDEAARPWLTLPKGIRAGSGARARAAFTAEEVGHLLSCERVPPFRRAFYRAVGILGLRPVEASRIQPGHIVQQGDGWLLLLPAADQKARRADPVHLTAAQAQEIRDNLPLVRVGLAHYEETFQRDLMRAKISVKQGAAVRRLYDLRSWMVSHLLREGVDLETVRQLARHRRIETTLRWYTRHSETRAAEVRAEVFGRMAKPAKARALTARESA